MSIRIRISINKDYNEALSVSVESPIEWDEISNNRHNITEYFSGKLSEIERNLEGLKD